MIRITFLKPNIYELIDLLYQQYIAASYSFLLRDRSSCEHDKIRSKSHLRR